MCAGPILHRNIPRGAPVPNCQNYAVEHPTIIHPLHPSRALGCARLQPVGNSASLTDHSKSVGLNRPLPLSFRRTEPCPSRLIAFMGLWPSAPILDAL
jgi:hypothetical protein